MIDVIDFGLTRDGEKVQLYTLRNKNGLTAKITNYGGILTSFTLPLPNEEREIVLGFDSLEEYTNEEYLKNYPYFGALIGRFGNRINKGLVTLDEKEIQLPCNNGIHHLHGGNIGFDRKVWKAEIDNNTDLKLTYLSPDGEENFPGNLNTEVIYKLTDDNELQIHYKAVTDKTTPVNLTQHAYFNLSDNFESILDHQLQIDTEFILETDDLLIPSGKIYNIKNTLFDFRTKKQIDRDIEDIENYDDCFAFGKSTETPRKVAELSDKNGEVTMEVATTFPGLQVYTGKYISAGQKKKFGPFSGVALEAQGYPDAPNHENFKQGWLQPGEVYQHQTNYKLIF
ncbi:aldose epimerase family protein [Labilibaculum sp. K2S]|uniref:aldose epimerase family protein n=1 Tax=Labilibaculum sp. K2S TaxID=3056386 RepID=UPI0025A3DE43|nr:aldose epimerase family protein [Labilibaculum sp. K2S]MDM8160091.1 aldose epimerase family protein [Labilibaculum sp. K2S]